MEIKLGGTELIDKGVSILKMLADKINPDRMPSPSFLMVFTAVGDYSYRRSDGALVVPIGCLKA
ncbi:MAG: hypothetical protein IKR25_07385 [Muribaculaceae bacterium]|nr:hypothetical protein [Muribaculaceae bacterium]